MDLDRGRFGLALRARRERAALSKRQLAQRVGISDSYLGTLEDGEAMPSVAVLARIAEALRITPDVLLEDYGLPTRRRESEELAEVMRDLDRPAQRYLRRVAEALRQLERERGGDA